MAEHKPGSMNIEAQEKTFAGFITFVTRASIAIIVVLILLAMLNG
ncbi:aa3-type cytochrome c oxidase subunit IV [Oceaniglobus trochenteri]|nr:aa3-type cytochrome c oxidase subunit IV [Oceaniglobus trochenteri]